MKRLFPFHSSSRPEPDGGVQIIEINDQAGADALDALASDTARDVFITVQNKPQTASDVANHVDISLQNAKYHLDNLREADLIDIAGTRYSRQGNEMNVYAPTKESFVLVAGPDETRSLLRETLMRVLGGIGVLAIGGFLVEKMVRYPGMGSVPSTPSSAKPPPRIPVQPVTEGGVYTSPGVVFVLGGITVLLTIVIFNIVASIEN